MNTDDTPTAAADHPSPDRQVNAHEWLRTIMRRSDLSRGARLVAAVLFTRMNAQGASCFPALATIARDAGWARDHSVLPYLDELERGGWLIRRRPQGSRYQTTSYFAVTPAGLGELPGLTDDRERDSSPADGGAAPPVTGDSSPADGGAAPPVTGDDLAIDLAREAHSDQPTTMMAADAATIVASPADPIGDEPQEANAPGLLTEARDQLDQANDDEQRGKVVRDYLAAIAGTTTKQLTPRAKTKAVELRKRHGHHQALTWLYRAWEHCAGTEGDHGSDPAFGIAAYALECANNAEVAK